MLLVFILFLFIAADQIQAYTSVLEVNPTAKERWVIVCIIAFILLYLTCNKLGCERNDINIGSVSDIS